MTCPACDNGTLYTRETIPGRAWCAIEDDGSIAYEGSTDVDWDCSESRTNADGSPLIYCNNPECDLFDSPRTAAEILALRTPPLLAPTDFAGEIP